MKTFIVIYVIATSGAMEAGITSRTYEKRFLNYEDCMIETAAVMGELSQEIRFKTSFVCVEKN